MNNNIMHTTSQKDQISIAQSQLDHTVAEWRKRKKELDDLGRFLDLAGQSYRKPVMVPIGTGCLAYMPGEIYCTGEVLVSLGVNWFAETSLHQAKRIHKRRCSFVAEQLDRSQSVYKELEVRSQMVLEHKSSTVDFDDDEVNEEGLKYVDIQEPYQEPISNPTAESTHASTKSPPRQSAKLLQNQFADADADAEEIDYDDNRLEEHELEDFDKNLLAKLKLMEMEEKQEADGAELDNSEAVVTKNRNRQQPVQTSVIERGFGDDFEGDSDDESDLDNMVLGQQVSIEYHHKRNQFLKADILQKPIDPNDEEMGHYEPSDPESDAKIVVPSGLPPSISHSGKLPSGSVVPLHVSESSGRKSDSSIVLPMPASIPPSIQKPKLSRFKQQQLDRRQNQ
ncbi:uri1, prefoldin-like chaperone [Batrachochytrium dendrobatidis]|nr:uri1, prefoldin-like chaperone [Batrachochytrium dendrobatidis]